MTFAGLASLHASFMWLFYLALEPVIRRRWPESLISWSRLLSGDWRDSLVGRDVLAGCAAAFLLSGVHRLFSDTAIQLDPGIPGGIMGPGSFVAWLAESLGIATAIALGVMVAFFLLRRLLRRDWIVALVVGLSLGSLFFLSGATRAALVWLPLSALLLLYLSVRFGLLAVTVWLYCVAIINESPMTLDTSAWYFRTGLATFLFVVVLSFVAFRISLGGRRLLKEIED